MAGRKFKAVNSLENRMISVAGNFNTTSGIATLNEGNGVAVSYNAVGDYTLTLADQYPALLSAVVSLEVADNVATDVFGVDVGEVDMSAKTVNIRAWDTTNDNLANMVSGVCHFNLSLRNSTI